MDKNNGKIGPYDAQETHVEASFSFGTGTIELYIYLHKREDNFSYQMHGSEILKVKHGDRPPGPSFSISIQEATRLMDMLWRAGIKPSEIGTVGHLEATKYHLEDMRKLVSKEYDVKL